MSTEIILCKSAITYNDYMILVNSIKDPTKFPLIKCDTQVGGMPPGDNPITRTFNFLFTCLRPNEQRRVDASVWYDNVTVERPSAAALEPATLVATQDDQLALTFQNIQDEINAFIPELEALNEIQPIQDDVRRSNESHFPFNNVNGIEIYAAVSGARGGLLTILPIVVIQPDGELRIGMVDKVNLALEFTKFAFFGNMALTLLQIEKVMFTIESFGLEEFTFFEAQIPFMALSGGTDDKQHYYLIILKNLETGETAGILTEIPLISHYMHDNKYIHADQFMVLADEYGGTYEIYEAVIKSSSDDPEEDIINISVNEHPDGIQINYSDGFVIVQDGESPFSFVLPPSVSGGHRRKHPKRVRPKIR